MRAYRRLDYQAVTDRAKGVSAPPRLGPPPSADESKHCHCPFTDAVAHGTAETSVLINGYLKDLLNTKTKEATKFHLTLYGSHMVNNLKGGLDFYLTTKQTIISLRYTTHPCQ